MLRRSPTRCAQRQEEQELPTRSLGERRRAAFGAQHRAGAGAEAVVSPGLAFSVGLSLAHLPRSQRGRRAEKPRRGARAAAPAPAPAPAPLPPRYLQRTLLVEAHVAEEPGRALARPGRERDSFQS